MAKKLIIIMANTDPANTESVGAPIFQACVAAAMGYDVEVICTAQATTLMRKGVAAAIKQPASGGKSILDFIKEAHDTGVKFYCCSPGLDIHQMHKEDLIAECNGIVGAAHFIEDIMTGESKVLTY